MKAPWFGLTLASAWLLFPGAQSQASFHIMQIEQVVGGVGGNPSAQAIQLRMRAAGQNLVSQARLRAWDATGANPVLVLDFNANVAAQGVGVRVLVVTAAMATYTSPTLSADFTATSAIPESYLAGGSLTFEDNFGTVYWRLSWGSYTGDTTGSVTNDANGEFGPVYPGPLPSSQNLGLLFQGNASAPSTSNAADYSLTEEAAVLTNNGGASFTVGTISDVVPRFTSEPLRSVPNPFNPETRIHFSPERAGKVQMQIFDLRGKWIRTLLDGHLPAGPAQVTWDGRDAQGRPVSSGSYVARLRTADRVGTCKLILAK